MINISFSSEKIILHIFYFRSCARRCPAACLNEGVGVPDKRIAARRPSLRREKPVVSCWFASRSSGARSPSRSQPPRACTFSPPLYTVIHSARKSRERHAREDSPLAVRRPSPSSRPGRRRDRKSVTVKKIGRSSLPVSVIRDSLFFRRSKPPTIYNR